VVAFVEGAVPRPMGAPRLWRPVVIVGLALLVVAIATRPLAQRISRPLERLTAAARRLGGGDLSARAPADGAHARRGDEIGELTRAFNEMAERVERLVRSEKDLLANVSHELRSPLARIRVALALLPCEADGDDRRVRDVERDLAELDRLIEDVLTAARLDVTACPRASAPSTRACSSRTLRARASRPAHRRPAGARGGRAAGGLYRRRVAAAPCPLEPRRERGEVRRAADHPVGRGRGREGGARRERRRPGVAPADRERVFEPFYRGDAARTPDPGGDDARRGVGLGLTLARRIAEVHGGAIAIGPASEADGPPRGCRVVLTIPLSS